MSSPQSSDNLVAAEPIPLTGALDAKRHGGGGAVSNVRVVVIAVLPVPLLLDLSRPDKVSCALVAATTASRY